MEVPGHAMGMEMMDLGPRLSFAHLGVPLPHREVPEGQRSVPGSKGQALGLEMPLCSIPQADLSQITAQTWEHEILM